MTTRYVHGPGIDEPLLAEQDGSVVAVHADALGSITALSDASQTLVEDTAYTSFGRLTRSGGGTGNAYAYTGREWEPELGLYYYRARYYDPEAGRFLSRDPIGFAGGDTNLYAYVRGTPTDLIDPSGLNPAAWIVKILRKGGKPQKVRALDSQADARRALRQGKDVQSPTEQQARATSQGAFPNQPIVRHPGHPLSDGTIGAPHYKLATAKKIPHSFWAGALAFTGSMLDPLGALYAEELSDNDMLPEPDPASYACREPQLRPEDASVDW